MLKLETLLVEKPWGRTDLPDGFPSADGLCIGEIEHRAPDGVAAPLLAKHIFTSERLSIQVHPDDDQAAARGLKSGKTECWLVLAADPGATIGIGGKSVLTAEQLRTAALDGSIERWLDWHPVSPGDFFLVPAGTIHAIGAGIALVEIQQNIAVTYRLFDYGRPRELHLDDGVLVANPCPYPGSLAARTRSGDTLLADIPQFRVRYLASPGAGFTGAAGRESLLVPIKGRIELDGKTAAPGTCFAASGATHVAMGPDAALLVAEA